MPKLPKWLHSPWSLALISGLVVPLFLWPEGQRPAWLAPGLKVLEAIVDFLRRDIHMPVWLFFAVGALLGWLGMRIERIGQPNLTSDSIDRSEPDSGAADAALPITQVEALSTPSPVSLSDREAAVLAILGLHYHLGRGMTSHHISHCTEWALLNVDVALDSLREKRLVFQSGGRYLATAAGRSLILKHEDIGKHMKFSKFKVLDSL